MKSGTPSHIKTKKLKMLLKLPLWQAVGLLESLWQFTGDCADDGGIGRYSNEDIAAWLEWERDPDELINALIHCRWLDPHPVHRLVVHDWEEERPYYVEERIRKREERKRRTRPQEEQELSGRVQESDGHVRQNSGQSDPTKPNQTQPNQNSIEERLSSDAIEGLRQAAGEIFRKTGYTGKDGLTFWKTAHLMTAGKIPWEIVETVSALTRSNSSDKPPAYFRRTLVKECKANGIDAETLLGSVRLPKHFDRGPPAQSAPDSSVLAIVNALSRKDTP